MLLDPRESPGRIVVQGSDVGVSVAKAKLYMYFGAVVCSMSNRIQIEVNYVGCNAV